MPCPECKAEDRLCVQNGKIYRKKAITPGNTMGAKVQRYLCQNCGYTGRGQFFGLPEYDTEEETVIEEE